MALKNLAQWMARRPARDRRARAKTAGPTSLGALLAALDGELPCDAGPISAQVWLDMVGPRIADRSTPARIEPTGSLLILVPDAVWAQELSLLSSTIVARLSTMGVRVTGLRFIVAKVDPPRRGPTRVERRKVAAPIELPPELRSEMDAIEDPDLRRAMVQAASCSLAQQRPRLKKTSGKR